jgi:hypothetical protein
MRRVRNATRDDYAPVVAAVLLLVFLPVLAAVLFLFGSFAGHMSIVSMLAGLVFVVLGAGMVVGMMRMSVGWDREQHR